MRKIVCLVSTGALAIATAPLATAQTTSQTPSDAGDIVVTAQKRTESVNRVPISISVLTQDSIVASGVAGTQQLEIATPGLVFGNTNGFAQPYIRGIGTDLFLPGQESPVGFYIDGVYLPFSSNLLQEFGDIERVEVLKGPQGTLYGRNTTGGAVNIITRDPDGVPTLEGQVTFGTRGTRKFVGYASAGLTEGISASVSGVISKHSGFFRVLNNGTRADNLDQWGVRGKIKLTPTENLTVVLSGDYLKKDDSSATVFTAVVGSTANPTVPGIGPSFVPRTTYTDGNPPPHRRHKDWGLNGTVSLDLGSVGIKSITGYRHDYFFSSADGDGTTRPNLFFDGPQGSKQFSQELQFTSQTDSALQWIGGLYYVKGTVFIGPEGVWTGVPNGGPPSVTLAGKSGIRSYAAYGQATFSFTDNLKLIGGLRYSNERRTLKEQSVLGFDILDPATRAAFGFGAVPRLSDKQDSLDPKVTLQYETNGQMVYGTFSKGFKSGSYLLISPSDSGPLAPEKITSYEVGGKHRITDSGVRFNWALFHYKYKDIQVNVKDPTVGGIASAQNAAETKGKGVDFDLTLPIIPERFTATLGGEYLDVKYKNFPNASVFNIVNGVLDTVATTDLISVDVSGNRAVRAPKLTLSGQVMWTLPLPGGKVDTTATIYHNSGFYFDPGNLVRQPKYNIVNLNVKFTTEDEHISFAVFANNLFNKTVILGINGTAFYVGAGYNDPRVIGITGSFKL